MERTAILILLATLAACASRSPPPRHTPVAADPVPIPAPAPAPAPAPPVVKGDWCVSLISVRTVAKSERLRDEYARQNYPVGIETVEVEGTTWHRVLFTGLVSRDDANALLPQLEQQFGVSGGWVPRHCNPRT
jgi:cell division septation protein DedD